MYKKEKNIQHMQKKKKYKQYVETI